MKGRVPKPPALLRRRNKVATRAQLTSSADAAKLTVHALPTRKRGDGPWHPRVRDWWTAVCRSPMAPELLGSDLLGGLYLLAELYQLRWTTDDARLLINLASEIRQQEVRFGLSPIDRRRLQWEIEKGEQADEKVQRRKKSKTLDEVAKKDPRDVLRQVK